MAALRAAAAVPIEGLRDLLFTQAFPKRGPEIVAEMRAAGVPDLLIARQLADAGDALDTRRDARDFEELRQRGLL